MDAFTAEIVGTALLMLIGIGVNANVVLADTKGHGSGWIVITAGWGVAVFAAVATVGEVSGAHINPAVSVGLALAGRFPWAEVPAYVTAQLLGALIGTTLAVLAYQRHFVATREPGDVLGTLATGPAIRAPGWNLLTEVVGTFVLVFVVLHFVEAKVTLGDGEMPVGLGAVGALPVGLLVFGLGMGLGGPTGYAINPARDLAPRLVHTLLPLPGKGHSDWAYAWVPVLGPLLGATCAAWLTLALTGG